MLSDPYAGLQAQALGLAEAAGFAPRLVDLRPRFPWRHLPAALWPDALGATRLVPPAEPLVFTPGGVGAAVGAALRRRGHVAVQVQNPRMRLDRFDAVVAARHDDIEGPNVIVTRTALHRASPARLAAAREAWAERLAFLPRPLACVLVGGSNGRFRLGPPEGEALATGLASLAREKWGVAVTPSRRTDPAVRLVLAGRLAPLGGWVWDLTGENPYFGLLACADLLVVTIDSVSMMSEAVATDAPVLLASLPGRSRRIARFLDLLRQEGRVRDFDGQPERWPVRPLDDTAEAAAALRHRLGF